MFQGLDPATLGGHQGTGIIFVKRAPDDAVTEAAGRWLARQATSLPDLEAAYREHRAVTYRGPVEDPRFPGVAVSGELEVRIVLVQENKDLGGEVIGYTFILDPVRPLSYEREA